MQSDTRPLRGAGQDNEGDCSSGKVLLVADSSVGREQQVNRGFLCGSQQRAVVQLVPSSGVGGDDRVPGKRTGKALGVPWSKRMRIERRAGLPRY